MHEIVKGDMPVMLDFWAPWCVPCKRIALIVDEIEKEYQDRVRVVRINLDVPESRELATTFQVRTVPSLLVFKQGVFFQQIPQGATKSGICEILDRAIEFKPSIF